MSNQGPAPAGKAGPASADWAKDGFTPGPETIDAYRGALGAFGTGVTVVTTLSKRGPLAMTANSFTSVSLDPPLVLWCPARASMRHDAFVAADAFVIHVMAEDQHQLASHFSRDGEDFAGVEWQSTALGQPVLPCLARFECHRSAVYDGGDHSIVLGQVDRVWQRPGAGLLFKRGLFGGFSPAE